MNTTSHVLLMALFAACVAVVGLGGVGSWAVEALEHQFREMLAGKRDVLCQRLFGKKSERVDPRQLQLALDAKEIIFARVAAEQKMLIVQALQHKGEIVAVNVPRPISMKFGAPKTQVMGVIINGLLGSNLNWAMILISHLSTKMIRSPLDFPNWM